MLIICLKDRIIVFFVALCILTKCKLSDVFFSIGKSDSPSLPPVQVIDKTLSVKQMHVLEPQDLLILRADKGVCVYVFVCVKRGCKTPLNPALCLLCDN